VLLFDTFPLGKGCGGKAAVSALKGISSGDKTKNFKASRFYYGTTHFLHKFLTTSDELSH